MNAAMWCEGNGTLSSGPSEPHMHRVHESPSVCNGTVISDGTDDIGHGTWSVKG
ncbi:MAG TPA: hypothetical protein VMS89_01200 [Methanoregulaceae archaeon]|nr:hypothetical protein [Methanoregulaceae archaeon]